MQNQHVYIVDDDQAVRDSAEFLVSSVGLQAKTYASAQAFLDDAEPKAGCLVLDVRMPGMGGMALHKKLHAEGSALPVIFVTGHADVPMAVEAMKYGAADFIQKPYRDQDLLDCIHKALASSRSHHEQSEQRQKAQQALALLTKRERQVMDLVVAGKPNKLIASELNISQRTVEVYRAKVMEKTDCRSLAELVQLGMRAQAVSF